MRRRHIARLLTLAASLSVVFGVVDRIVQDHSEAGWYLANAAGLWLAVAFVFGALASGRIEAWILGLFSEMSALAGYYGYGHFVVHHHEPLHIAAFWVFCGLLVGPVFGLIGYRWRRRRSELAGLTLGVAFVAEALLLGLTHNRPQDVSLLETIAGLIVAAGLLVAARWRKQHGPDNAGGHFFTVSLPRRRR